MSLDHLDKSLATHDLVQDLKWDPALREEWQRDMDAVHARYDLTPEEERALRDRDFGALYDLGVHQYLLAQLARLYYGTDEKRGASEAATALMRSLKGRK